MPGLWSSVWGRAFAAVYEPLLAGAEDAWLREQRRALLSRAYGRVLEIGAGTGLNVPLYPETVTELVLTEPDPWMAERLAGRAGVAQVRLVPAERLPFPDADFDTAVSTLALRELPLPARATGPITRPMVVGSARA